VTHALHHGLRPPGIGEVVVGRWDEWAVAAAVIGPDRATVTRLAMALDEELGRLSGGWRGGRGQPDVTISLGLAAADAASAGAFRRVELLIHAANKAAEASHQAGGSCLRTFTPRQAA
jgi:GGDEF domain-containing protein